MYIKVFYIHICVCVCVHTHTHTHTHTYIYIFLFIFFSIVVYHRRLNIVPNVIEYNLGYASYIY